MLLLLHAGLVQVFLKERLGRGVGGELLLFFWSFRVGAYSNHEHGNLMFSVKALKTLGNQYCNG